MDGVFRRRWRERPRTPRRRSPALLVLCFHASRRVSYRARLPRVSSVYDRNGSRSPRLDRVARVAPSFSILTVVAKLFEKPSAREGKSVVAVRGPPPWNKNIEKCMGVDSMRSLRCRRTRVYLVRGRRDSIKIVYLGEPGDVCTAGFAWLRVAMGSPTSGYEPTSCFRSESSGILERERASDHLRFIGSLSSHWNS